MVVVVVIVVVVVAGVVVVGDAVVVVGGGAVTGTVGPGKPVAPTVLVGPVGGGTGVVEGNGVVGAVAGGMVVVVVGIVVVGMAVVVGIVGGAIWQISPRNPSMQSHSNSSLQVPPLRQGRIIGSQSGR